MECPIFYPTQAEFQNFESYMEKIEQEAEGFGMVKVVPPLCWKARRKGYNNITPVITHPVKQIVSGFAGIYQVILISENQLSYQKYKNYSIKRDLRGNLTPDEIERQVFFI